MIACIKSQEPAAEFRADLVVVGADGGPENRNNIGPFGTKVLHRCNGIFKHAVDRAFPARMGGTDDTGFGIAKQHRAAVRRKSADGDPRLVGNHGVDLRPFAIWPWTANHLNGCRMHLVGGQQIFFCNLKMGSHPCPVFTHGLRVIVGAKANVQPGIDTVGTTALTGEKSVVYGFAGCLKQI